MKSLILLPLCFALVFADGQHYSFGYSTADGQTRSEIGAGGNVAGQYSYYDANGELRQVRYRADETGFHPEGDITVDKHTAINAAHLGAYTHKTHIPIATTKYIGEPQIAAHYTPYNKVVEPITTQHFTKVVEPVVPAIAAHHYTPLTTKVVAPAIDAYTKVVEHNPVVATHHYTPVTKTVVAAPTYAHLNPTTKFLANPTISHYAAGYNKLVHSPIAHYTQTSPIIGYNTPYTTGYNNLYNSALTGAWNGGYYGAGWAAPWGYSSWNNNPVYNKYSIHTPTYKTWATL